MRWIILLILACLDLQAVSQARYIHVLVALCDNKNQGIVPVPKKIGNGQDPPNNLYWGCGYGVKTFFGKQKEWILVKKTVNPDKNVLERIVFRHKDSLVYLVADAYDGAKIRNTVSDFLDYAAGKHKTVITLDSTTISAGGSADMICYVGHNGLMDFAMAEYPVRVDTCSKDVIILACASKPFFYDAVVRSGARPLIWTTNLMCPEAYTLDAAIDSWISYDKAEATREKAAQAYNQYQKCGIKGARNLIVTGL